MTEAQDHITAFWSAVAPDYEAHSGNVAAYGSQDYGRWLETLAEVLPPPPARILDIAAGTGYLALAAAALGHTVTASDLSPAMLRELKSNAGARGLSVDIHLDDAVAPRLAPGSFDVVTSRHLLWTLREPAVAMANWWALLRPGGRLVAVDGFWFTDSSENPPPLFADHYTPATRDELPFMGLAEPGAILAELERAGFVEVAADPRPGLRLQGDVPYLFTGRRP
jgi:SAM-dependent methyltransferase